MTDKAVNSESSENADLPSPVDIENAKKLKDAEECVEQLEADNASLMEENAALKVELSQYRPEPTEPEETETLFWVHPYETGAVQKSSIFGYDPDLSEGTISVEVPKSRVSAELSRAGKRLVSAEELETLMSVEDEEDDFNEDE